MPISGALGVHRPVRDLPKRAIYVGEFWEQQMVGERDIDLDQKSALLDRGDEVCK